MISDLQKNMALGAMWGRFTTKDVASKLSRYADVGNSSSASPIGDENYFKVEAETLIGEQVNAGLVIPLEHDGIEQPEEWICDTRLVK